MTRLQKKRSRRLERGWHIMEQRWRDSRDRSYPFPRRKRWRNMPPQIFEYRMSCYNAVRSDSPGVSMTVAL